MKCKLCDSELEKIWYHHDMHRWSYEIENMYDDRYILYRCSTCGLVYALEE